MSNQRIDVVNPENDYDTYLKKSRELIANELSKVIFEINDLGLYDRIKYVLQTRGKLLRPILVILSTQSVGGYAEDVKKLALAVELLHVATLIHDDILDQDQFRRNAQTVSAKWGVRDAILVGDALASLSFSLTVDYGTDVTKVMSQTCLLLSDGEYMDVKNMRKRMRESDYMATIMRKSASLFRAATKCGAMAAKSTSDETEALASFGENFGLAYQIKDDLSDVMINENDIPQDIREFRATLPIIHLYASLNQSRRKELFQKIAIFKDQSSAEKNSFLLKLKQALQTAGTIAYCADKVDYYTTNAIKSLEPVRKSVYRDYLIQMAKSLRLKRP